MTERERQAEVKKLEEENVRLLAARMVLWSQVEKIDRSTAEVQQLHRMLMSLPVSAEPGQ